ncbi:PH domain-containing protein [Micromonospora nigra]|uniref:PH domain-containing protein n=1 Tax=Micromonospora nigra TaxID=145857 RepID=A0A1C6RY16_9ACTN|nr:PH domain-containing protein [Micromonospora nigra]SCL22115.1 PH domain-containing protein [Micromonospora nigra]
MHEETSPRQWRVRPALPVLKTIGAVALVGLGVLFAQGDLVRPVLAATAAAVLLGWAVRDWVAPVRLGVDDEGVTVLKGWSTYQRLPWRTVESVDVTRRSGRGLAGEVLEIDAGETLHLLSRNDLGAEPAEVAEAVRAARPATG